MRASLGMRNGFLVAACALVCVGGVAFGQRERVTYGPVSKDVLNAGLVIDTVHFAPLDVRSLLAEDRQRELSGEVPRFAVNKEVDYTPDRFGTVQLLDDGRVAWRLRIECEGAHSVNIGTMFDVPDSLSMYLLDGNGHSFWGEFTSADNFNGQMWSPIVGGQVMEVYAEMDEGDWGHFAAGFRIMYVNIGYRGVGDALAGHAVDGTRSDECHTDVACKEADPWCEEVKGAACYTLFGTGMCSGAVLNNTAEDERPLFYTAFHCQMQDFATQSRVYFNFQNAVCREPGSASSGGSGTCGPINSGGFGCNTETISGASVVATQQNADSVLMELGTAIPDSFEVVYLGWSVAETPPVGSPSAPFVGIHHPGVEEKRIAFEEDFVSKQVISISYTVNAWAVDYDNGGLEGGSSGSPLLDPNHYVIGTATAVNSFANICAQNQWYGRLEHAWDLNSDFRMALDPVGSGTTELWGSKQFFPDTAPELFGFELVAPDAGEADVPTGPMLEWNGACYTDDYRVLVSEHSNLSSPVVDQMVSAPTTILDLVDGTLDPGTLYYWRVEALNTIGATLSSIRTFTTVTPPGAFNLVSPSNGAVDVETNPELDWDDSSDADDYLVEVDDDSGFGSPEWSNTVVASTDTLPGGTLAYSTEYFWRVTANNANGSTGSTPSMASFTTVAPPCGCVGNLDEDCDTDVFDFGIFATAFGSMLGDANYNPDADLDNDNDVDVFDFGIFGPDFGCTE